MKNNMIQNTTLKFLRELNAHNHKEWFEAHRKQYESARENFAETVEEIIAKHGKKDSDISSLTAKECMFRINRDVRFSKDKSPYKTNFGASFNRGGKKSIFAGYYFHCEPGKSFAGGGLWMPEAEPMKKIRQEIDYNWDDFKKIIKNNKFAAEYGDLTKDEETSLVREPKGYEKTNPAIDYIKLKCWIALKPISDKDLTGPDLIKKVLSAFDALQPLVKFLNAAME
jgi:uncharacterized protein (TIGR02453 family)